MKATYELKNRLPPFARRAAVRVGRASEPIVKPLPPESATAREESLSEAERIKVERHRRIHRAIHKFATAILWLLVIVSLILLFANVSL